MGQQQMIGQVLQALGQIRAYEMGRGRAAADASYQDLIQKLPGDPDVLITAARQLASYHHYTEAEVLLERVSELADGNPDIEFMLGHVHFLIEQPGKALHHYEPLLETDMARVPLLTEIGIAYASLGDTDRARTCFAEAIEGDGSYVPALHELMLVHSVSVDDALLEKVNALRMQPMQQRFDWNARLAHAAGTALDRLDQHDEAFTAFENVGRLMPPMPPFNEQSATDMHTEAREFWTCDRLERGHAHCQIKDRPIFILGMPRSGTTLAEQILLGCSDTTSIGEAPALIEAYTPWTKGAFLTNAEPLLPEKLVGADCLAQAGQAYMSTVEGADDSPISAPRIIDKTPTNYVALGFIRAALPAARIIHCMRDPLDVCWSAFTTWFRTPTRWSHDLASIGRFYGRYHQLMMHWHAITGDEIHVLSYEDLVADPEDKARCLVDHCGLEWSDDCLDLAKPKGAIATPSMTHARQPIYTSSVKRYESYLAYMGPLIDELQKAGVPLPDGL